MNLICQGPQAKQDVFGFCFFNPFFCVYFLASINYFEKEIEDHPSTNTDLNVKNETEHGALEPVVLF